MEKKAILFEIEHFTAEDRTLIGYASTFGMPADSAGDVIEKGAFAKTILNLKKNWIPLLDGHKQDCNSVLGTVIDATEDDHGLLIKATLAETPYVDEIRQKLLQGHINKLSIGFFIESQEFREVNGETLRFIKEADLVEVSVVPIPANSRAEIVSVKNRDTTPPSTIQRDVAESKKAKESTSFCQKSYLNTLYGLLEVKLNITKGKLNNE